MTPNRTALLLFAASILLSLALLLMNPAWWSFAFNVSAFILALLAVDGILSLRRGRLTCALSAPASLGIGDSGALRVSIAPARHQWRTPLTLIYDARGPAAPVPPVHVDLEPGAGCEVDLPIRPQRRGTIRISTLWIRWLGPLGLMQTVLRLLASELQPLTSPVLSAAL